MNFYEAKENIQPLATGRNASVLHASLNMESSQELTFKRQELENGIHNYIGQDPLSAWYNYIDWIEQSFPSGGKESGLKQVLAKCLNHFADDERYYQDGRMIKLFIKFMDDINDATVYYQRLFNCGFGSMVADFYISWAYSYELEGNMRRADEIFSQGIACRAQPVEDLKEAHQHFGFAMARRLLYKEDEAIKEETNRQLSERRSALSSLKGFKRKNIVGSVRTGSAVKSATPGTVKTDRPSSSKYNHEQVQIGADENNKPGPVDELKRATDSIQFESVKNVIASIISAARNQENEKEAGPWYKTRVNKKSGKLFQNNVVSNRDFEILDDDLQCSSLFSTKSKFNMNFKYPKTFFAKNKPQKEWMVPVTTEEAPDKGTLPEYKKYMLYPRPNVEFSIEEHMAYNYFKKLNIKNNFTLKRDEFWSNGPTFNVRQYPHFAKQSKPETPNETYVPSKVDNLMFNYDKIYDPITKEEYQFEELYAKKKSLNETIADPIDMEETFCVNNAKTRRKSFFPIRKSIIATAFINAPKELRESAVCDYSNIPGSTQTPVTTAKLNVCPDPSLQKECISKNKSTKSDDSECIQYIESEKSLAAPSENSFKFSPPALPDSKEAKVMPFHIFEDTVAQPIKKSIKCNTERPSEGYLDLDETCSTQTFNILLKPQSVSTPKPVAKTTQRQFGTVLKEAISPTNSKILQHCMENQEQAIVLNPPLEINDGVSPFCKQLSTILEASEQGSNEGTTKSTTSSAENVLELHNASSIKKTEREQSLQKSEIPCKEKLDPNSKEEKMLCKAVSTNTLEIQTISRSSANPFGTCNFAIYEEDAKVEKNAIVNLTRLEEKEPTVGNLSIKVPSLRFQEEKTETATKIFQEDKTETIPDIFVLPQNAIQFQTDANETFSDFFLAPPTPCKFNDENFDIFSNSPLEGEKSKTSNKPDPYQEVSFGFTQTLSKRQQSLNNSNMKKVSDLQSETNKNTQYEEVDAAFYCYETNSKNELKNFSKADVKLIDSSMPDISLIECKPYQQQKNDHIKQNLLKIEKSKENNISYTKVDSFIEASSNTNIKENKSLCSSLRNIHLSKGKEIEDDNEYDNEMSIYYKNTPKTPKILLHLWEEDGSKTPEKNAYIHISSDDTSGQKLINETLISSDVNPFNADLIQAYLEELEFTQRIENRSTCMLMAKIPQLIPKQIIAIHDTRFEVIKFINSGAYGAVYRGKNLNTGQMCALKQERPPKPWEYYICLIIKERMFDEMHPAYMSVDYALIGNNSSILISEFSQYGSLITVCNKIKKSTTKNIDEYVVMLLATELLDIIDHLHAANIIHADIKADNFLLMNTILNKRT
uniref:BUB1 N-terminal domain-containing protein n=1 Tax=Glossina brevipalpis TaxID=37001 RepID=A0A1A9W234_9MUSC